MKKKNSSPHQTVPFSPSPGFVLPRTKITLSKKDILEDYEIGFKSRLVSILGRKEVLTGKAKFGIFGDGKETPQLAMARAFENGDFRSGYYRDQTFMFATKQASIEGFFAQLYADTDPAHEPASSGRMMNAHFGTPFLDSVGHFLDLTKTKNSSSDISPTAGQMARLLGLAYASKIYRNEKTLAKNQTRFSKNGNEIAFGTIGDASTSEGIFFETLNAAGVLQVPLIMSVWDDGYGISVPRQYQTNLGSVSDLLAGFASEREGEGFIIETVKAWDYPALVDAYLSVAMRVRRTHKPALIHVTEVTQPLGHSTSGSHERYKSAERLQWEKDTCCLAHMRDWIIKEKIANEKELVALEARTAAEVEDARSLAWSRFQKPLKEELSQGIEIVENLLKALPPSENDSGKHTSVQEILSALKKLQDNASAVIYRRLIQSSLHKVQLTLLSAPREIRKPLDVHLGKMRRENHSRFNSHLVTQTMDNPLLRKAIPAVYGADEQTADGRVVLLKCFEKHLEREPGFFALGEDVGKLGDVNLVFEGLNEKFGDLRVTDTGIREATILGQGIGCAMRGLRPLVDIQYLDYLLYALQVMSDDLATLHYRTAGMQKCPVIIRTKGHRLEGIWHTGSPMGTILGAIRGIYLCVPRNMTQAAGMYNILLRSDNPALVIEVLNGYRLKERIPANVDSFQVPLGEPEVLREGVDVTLVTYGACCRIALEAADFLHTQFGIEVEVIDVQTLLPFDLPGTITKSICKTNAVLFLDEDVPGGATAYMMQEVLEKQGGFQWLDQAPRTLTAQPNRTAYASDGDYFCKPSVENVVEMILTMMRENQPLNFPEIGDGSEDIWSRAP